MLLFHCNCILFSGTSSLPTQTGFSFRTSGAPGVRYQSSSTATVSDKNASSKAATKTKSAAADDDFPFPVKRVKFTTCKELYGVQVQTGAVDKPVEGIEVDVGYIDTGYPEIHASSEHAGLFPTVLCLHGAAGSHKDMADLISTLTAKGARVLCPNFPGKILYLSVCKFHHTFRFVFTTIVK